MTDFIASNGKKISAREPGKAYAALIGGLYLSKEDFDALREFFQAERDETEWEYRASHAWDGREVITTAPQGFSSEQWIVERRQVNPKKVLTEWLQVPDTTNNEEKNNE